MSLQTRIAALISAIGTDVKSLYAHAASTVNPHAVTKTQVGLGNVDNTSNATERAATATLTNKSFGNAVTITDNSASPALKVTQTGSGNALEIHDVASDTTPFVIDANGNTSLGALSVFRQQTGSVTFDATPTVGANDGLIWNASASTGYYAWQAGGVERMRISSTGVVDVTSDKIRINSTNNDSALEFHNTGVRKSYIRDYGSGLHIVEEAAQPILFYANGTERMRIDSAGRVGIGAVPGGDTSFWLSNDITGATTAYGFRAIQTIKTPVTTTAVVFQSAPSIESGAALSGGLQHYAAVQDTFTGTTASQFGFLAGASLVGATNNYGFYGDIPSGANRYNFYAAGTAVNAFNGNVEVRGASALLGYGTGAGGTVTQATSKATAVTLNKPTGLITTFNDALAAGASVVFQVNNSLISATDLCLLNLSRAGVVDADKYTAVVLNINPGHFRVRLTNISAGSLSEACEIKFAILKGSAS